MAISDALDVNVHSGGTGAVRKTVTSKPFSEMNEAEKREWHKQMTTN